MEISDLQKTYIYIHCFFLLKHKIAYVLVYTIGIRVFYYRRVGVRKNNRKKY